MIEVCEHVKRMEAGYWVKDNLCESEIDWWAKVVKGISQSRILTYDFLSFHSLHPYLNHALADFKESKISQILYDFYFL